MVKDRADHPREARSFRIPTDAPEADGTIAWDATTLVLVEVEAGGDDGPWLQLCEPPAPADRHRRTLAPVLLGDGCVRDPEALWAAMVAAVRNIGWRGRRGVRDLGRRCRALGFESAAARRPAGCICSDCERDRGADLRQRRLHVLFQRAPARAAREAGSNDEGCRFVKMKIGTASGRRSCSGSRPRATPSADAELFVDANGAYSRKQALAFAERFAALGVAGSKSRCRVTISRACGCCAIARRPAWRSRPENTAMSHSISGACWRPAPSMCLQADATRCCGYTGFLRAAALADAWSLPLSAHCAPALHLPRMLCGAAPSPHRMVSRSRPHRTACCSKAPRCRRDGIIAPDLNRPGHGLVFKTAQTQNASCS